jgi:hypothetical protein
VCTCLWEASRKEYVITLVVVLHYFVFIFSASDPFAGLAHGLPRQTWTVDVSALQGRACGTKVVWPRDCLLGCCVVCSLLESSNHLFHNGQRNGVALPSGGSFLRRPP